MIVIIVLISAFVFLQQDVNAKVGKMKYLPLLDMTATLEEERTVILQPLAKTYKEIAIISADRIKVYLERIENEPDEDWGMGMSNHTFLDGQITDIAYEFRLQRDAIASSLIMVAQSYLHSKFQNVVSAYDYFKKRKGFQEQFKATDLRDHYFSLGSTVENTSVKWAEAVKAASNYVRHFEEWNVSPIKLKKLSTGELIYEKITNIISELKENQRGTAQTLLNLNIAEEDLFDKRNNQSQRIVEILNLDNPDEFSKKVSEWLSEVMRELHKKFDSYDV